MPTTDEVQPAAHDATGDGASAALLLGPLLRYVDDTSASVWVETRTPARVRVEVDLPGGRRADGATGTLTLHGHHFALVVVPGLPAGQRLPYRVLVDDGEGEALAWPPPAASWRWPASEIRTPERGADLRLAFGSCRRAGDDGPESVRLVGVDALSALAHRMVGEHHAEERWPDLLLFVGDQVYADDPTPALKERLRERHRGGPDAGEDVREEIGDFEEYTWLYHETWGPEAVRWLLSTVPTCMLLDDHDLRDDWNTSDTWRREVSRAPWWRDRVAGAFASYWVYQHLGNLSPEELAGDALLARLRAEPDDAERDRLLDGFALRADEDPSTARWSFSRDLGPVRLVAVDSRCARRLAPGARRIADEAEWGWVREQVLGAQDEEREDGPARHVLLATTLPAFLLHGIHHAEGFDEAVADGAWGPRAARWAEALRQAADLEHWAAFRSSFGDLVRLLGDVAAGPRPPSSVLVLSGDVHCSYTARVRVPGAGEDGPAVHQLVMSPFRNPLSRGVRLANRLLDSRPARTLTRALAAAAGVRDPDVSWRVENGPWFDNGVMTVVCAQDGTAAVEVDHAVDDGGRPRLRSTLRHRLSAPGRERVTSA
ncbi:DUF7800 domain-containing protein [Kineococcus indalonis]|uniref:DUF7800 domain-containing protein n=1 Tax=Kineococcus indalonis TaxID=2696566 RepID=UPI001413633B|nr:alkaline phosphatase D family protein [Kineococcus indalonis]NAZ85899.1 alkaline phosphatase family protein [Kineococcus indalonis]